KSIVGKFHRAYQEYDNFCASKVSVFLGQANMKNKVKAVSLSLLLFSVTACSGGGGSGSRDTVDSEPGENNPGGVIDNELPSASILFPAQPGLWTDQQKIVIRGTSHDNAGIARVTVNGVEAESTD